MAFIRSFISNMILTQWQIDQIIHTNESNLLLSLQVFLPNQHKYWVKSAKTQQEEITYWAAS